MRNFNIGSDFLILESLQTPDLLGKSLESTTKQTSKKGLNSFCHEIIKRKALNNMQKHCNINILNVLLHVIFIN